MITFIWSKGSGNKKYKVKILNNDKIIKTVQFGDIRYEQYKDVTPLKLYSNLNHLDNKRRLNYRKRHQKILLKDGTPSYKKKYTPAWFSYKYLW